MTRVLTRRAAFYGLAACAALTLNFLLPRAMPGDPATALFARFRGQLSPEAISQLRGAFGLTDGPWWVQLWTYLSHLARGELGVSVTHFPAPVSEVIGQAMVWTLLLAGASLVTSFVLGSAIGVAAAWWRGTWVDLVPPALTFIAAFPYFWLAMVALFVFGLELGWFPLRHAHAAGLEPEATWTFAVDVAWHAALPVGTMVLTSLAGWVAPMRNAMIGVLGAEFVALARAKGLSPARVVLGYAARSALLPSVTGLGMAFGYVVGGALLTEIVFSYPGTGLLLVQAVRGQDYPLMQGIFLVIPLAVLAGNFAADVAVVLLDPRARRSA